VKAARDRLALLGGRQVAALLRGGVLAVVNAEPVLLNLRQDVLVLLLLRQVVVGLGA
jgi:hypothetical protein